MPNIGEIWRKDRYYQDDHGVWQTKYLIILGQNNCGDYINKLLTSRPHGRSTIEGCSHAYPFGGFFLGILGSVNLNSPTWIDTRKQNDIDSQAFITYQADFQLEMTISGRKLCEIISCVAAADDTTTAQAGFLRDTLAALSCD